MITIPDKDGKQHPIKIHDINSFDYGIYEGCSTLKDKRRNRLLNCINAFDIETTTLDADISFMYCWQWCTLHRGYYHVVMGRTWAEYIDHINRIQQQLDDGVRVAVYVHNLGYEFQYIRNFFEWDSVFASKPRQPIKALTVSGTEYRCSWKLTNMSLEAATNKEPGMTYVKYKDKIDYRKIRYPETPLDDEHLVYDILDVVSLCDLIKNLLKNNGDSIATIPLTSTGYVRRACRKRVRQEMPDYRDKVFLPNSISPDVYCKLKEAARGGNTHANRYFSSSLL